MDELTNPELKARLAASEEALRQAEIRATVGRLALEMIHEIRNPLEALSSMTFLARQEGGPNKVGVLSETGRRTDGPSSVHL
jgi:signal transduction histidine kinase